MDLVELQTQAEANYFLQLCPTILNLKHDYYHIGGSYIGVGMNEFYWMTTGQRVGYPILYAEGEPNNYKNNEVFFTIHKEPQTFKFNDISNFYMCPFICQRTTKLK